jgi:type VI secretion system protein ImpJ
MMLAPHHFQQQSLRMEQVLLYHVLTVAPFHWGVVQLQLDRVALVSGIFRVLELEAVMPDGLIIHHSADVSGGLEIDITAHADALSQSRIMVHLAVPAAKVGGNAVPGDLARYRSVEGPAVTDENSGEGEVRIPRLRPRLSLIVTTTPGQRPPQKYVSFPLAQVVYQNESFALTDFLPPTLAVTHQSPIGRLCADIARRAREKALFLAERSGSTSSTTNQPLIQETAAEIRALVAGLPPLEALIAAGVAHPFTVYLALCNLVGQMATFAVGSVPPVLSRYDHDNGMAAFNEIRDFALRMLDRVKEVAVAIPFHFDNGKFTLLVKDAWLARKLIVGVRGAAAMSDADVIGWIDNSLIASSSKIERLWEIRVKGAPRQQTESGRELGIVPSRGMQLFVIDNDPLHIVAGEVLEIWNPDSFAGRPRPAEIVLYAEP